MILYYDSVKINDKQQKLRLLPCRKSQESIKQRHILLGFYTQILKKSVVRLGKSLLTGPDVCYTPTYIHSVPNNKVHVQSCLTHEIPQLDQSSTLPHSQPICNYQGECTPVKVNCKQICAPLYVQIQLIAMDQQQNRSRLFHAF